MNFVTNYNDFLRFSNNNSESLFYIIEYSKDNYDKLEDKFSLMRNEILKHPQNFKDRLNNGVYRIWLTTPIETDW